MKQLNFLTLGSLFTLFVCIGCKKDSPTENILQPDKQIAHEVIGFAFGLVRHQSWIDNPERPIDTLYSRYAMITIDSTIKIFADTNGYFKIDSISIGKHLLTINHNYFEKFDTIIVIDTIQRLFFQMQPKLFEYFPIRINKKWKYKYEYLYRYASPWIESTFVGNIEWKIVEEKGPGKFVLQEVLYGTGTYYHPYYPEKNHSAYIGPDTSYTVLDTIDSYIRYSAGYYSYSNNTSYAWIPHYYFPSEDSVLYRVGDNIVTLKRGVGIVQWWYGHYGNNVTHNILTLESTEN